MRESLTPEEDRLVRRWTLGVLLVYGAIAVGLFGYVGLSQHLASGSDKSAASFVTTAADAREQRNR